MLPLLVNILAYSLRLDVFFKHLIQLVLAFHLLIVFHRTFIKVRFQQKIKIAFLIDDYCFIIRIFSCSDLLRLFNILKELLAFVH